MKHDDLAPFIPDYSEVSKQDALLLLSEPKNIEWCDNKGIISREDEADINSDILNQLIEIAQLRFVTKNKKLGEISAEAKRVLQKQK